MRTLKAMNEIYSLFPARGELELWNKDFLRTYAEDARLRTELTYLRMEITADMLTEYKIVLEFLRNHIHSPHTFRSYTRVMEQLVRWRWTVCNDTSICTMATADVKDFFKFCDAPPAELVMKSSCNKFERSGLRNEKWRPFFRHEKVVWVDGERTTVTSGASAMKCTLAQIKCLFRTLYFGGKMKCDPSFGIKASSILVRTEVARVRSLTTTQMKMIYTVIDEMCAEDSSHERTRFVFVAMHQMYVRGMAFREHNDYGETTVPHMSNFFQDTESGKWLFRTVGKKNKVRHVAVSDFMLAALKRWRAHLNLTELPLPDDDEVLIPRFGNPKVAMRSRVMVEDVSQLFKIVATRLEGKQEQKCAEALGAATPHWLRATGITEDVSAGRPVAHVRDDAGHDSIETTNKYIRIDEGDRVASKACVPAPEYHDFEDAL